MAGADEVENAQVAGAVDAVGDLQKDLLKFVFEEDTEKQVYAMCIACVCVCVRACVLGVCVCVSMHVVCACCLCVYMHESVNVCKE